MYAQLDCLPLHPPPHCDNFFFTGVNNIETTTNVTSLSAATQNLTSNPGFDPVPSVSALIRAAEVSEEGSPIFLFVDKEESDAELLNEALSILTLKNLRVYTFYPVFNDATSRKRSVSNKQQPLFRGKRLTNPTEIYRQIAIHTGGQIFEQVFSIFSASIILGFYANLPTRRTILCQSGTTASENLSFQVDKATTAIFISVSGVSVPSLTTPEGERHIICTHFQNSRYHSDMCMAIINTTTHFATFWVFLCNTKS